MARYRGPRVTDGEFSRRYRYLHERRVYDLIVNNKMDRHVVLTVPHDYENEEKNWRLNILTMAAQDMVSVTARDLVLGAGEQRDGGAPHIHLLTTRRDASRIKYVWKKAGYGIVKIFHADDRPDEYKRVVKYVQDKWVYDDGSPGNIIVGGHENTSRVA